MGFFTPNQQVDNFQTKSIAVPGPWLVSNFTRASQRRACPAIVRREFCLSASGSRHIANREDIVRHQHGGWRGAKAATIRPERWNCLTVSTSSVHRENTLRL